MLLASRLAIELAGRSVVTFWDGRLSCAVPLLPADGGVAVDRGRLRLPGHWVDLASEPTLQQRLADQLRRELPTGHVLDGTESHPIARCARCDDVLLRCGDHSYTVVHLTWRRAPETLTAWPSTQLHADPAALLADLADRHLA